MHAEVPIEQIVMQELAEAVKQYARARGLYVTVLEARDHYDNEWEIRLRVGAFGHIMVASFMDSICLLATCDKELPSNVTKIATRQLQEPNGIDYLLSCIPEFVRFAMGGVRYRPVIVW